MDWTRGMADTLEHPCKCSHRPAAPHCHSAHSHPPHDDRNCVIFGPPETVFEDGIFRLCMTFDESYPVKPPQVKFLTPIYHPNVYASGALCLDILGNRWWVLFVRRS